MRTLFSYHYRYLEKIDIIFCKVFGTYILHEQKFEQGIQSLSFFITYKNRHFSMRRSTNYERLYDSLVMYVLLLQIQAFQSFFNIIYKSTMHTASEILSFY